jgi:lipoyl synthase
MESPAYLRLSLAAAMTLGLAPGTFFRGARLRCVNLLLTYESGCRANCAFCGLARDRKKRVGDKGFIRVAWKAYETRIVMERLAEPPAGVGRVCLSMITHPRGKNDTLDLTRRIKLDTGLPTSLLITPTLLQRDDLEAMKEAGADRVGIAIDCATPDLFERLRGAGVNGPHRWGHYWRIYEQAVEVFGRDMAGVHLIVGLGETERDMVEAIDRARRLGGATHLFSFFPEKGSDLEKHPQPPISQYRRLQAARYLIDTDRIEGSWVTYDKQNRIIDFGLPQNELKAALADGVAFETSGCPGPDGRTACNRPYGNERPGPDIRNFPFTLEPDDMNKVLKELRDYGD